MKYHPGDAEWPQALIADGIAELTEVLLCSGALLPLLCE